jgi:6-pyruvoyltetrahydropterin/6-carboxytetrahydropterin synthase
MANNKDAQIGCLQIGKEAMKFSAAHFTLFPNIDAERLHGHNYGVKLTCKGPLDEYDMVIDLGIIKSLLMEIIKVWDERTLMPISSPDLIVESKDGQVEVTWRDRHYSFPAEDVVLLPMANITIEGMAKYICEEFDRRLRKEYGFDRLIEISVGVSESPSQWGIYTLQTG